jgi:hypothetical protein
MNHANKQESTARQVNRILQIVRHPLDAIT